MTATRRNGPKPVKRLHFLTRALALFSAMNFEELNLAQPIVQAVHEQGYTAPTHIQTQAIDRDRKSVV